MNRCAYCRYLFLVLQRKFRYGPFSKETSTINRFGTDFACNVDINAYLSAENAEWFREMPRRLRSAHKVIEDKLTKQHIIV